MISKRDVSTGEFLTGDIYQLIDKIAELEKETKIQQAALKLGGSTCTRLQAECENRDRFIAKLELQSKSRSDTIVGYSNRITELEKESDEFAATIEYLLGIDMEQGYTAPFTLIDYLGKHPCGDTLLQAHNLKQQANALDDLLDAHDARQSRASLSPIEGVPVDFINLRINKLRNQAKALKEREGAD